MTDKQNLHPLGLTPEGVALSYTTKDAPLEKYASLIFMPGEPGDADAFINGFAYGRFTTMDSELALHWHMRGRRPIDCPVADDPRNLLARIAELEALLAAAQRCQQCDPPGSGKECRGGMNDTQNSDGVPVGAELIATKVADRCHGKRKVGQAPERYAMIWQAARLGALEAIARIAELEAHIAADPRSKLDVAVEALLRSREGWENALELGLIPERHRSTAEILAEGCRTALATIGGTNEQG